MERYKKKSLNFMGYSKDLRVKYNNSQRSVSRFHRFSINRPLNEDENMAEEKKEIRKIPAIVKPNTQANSRVELLQKWKQEKAVKKQLESKLIKPAFKVGVVKSDPSPSMGNKPLFGLDSSTSLSKSSFLKSSSQFSGKKQESHIVSNTKTGIKQSRLQPPIAKSTATLIAKGTKSTATMIAKGTKSTANSIAKGATSCTTSIAKVATSSATSIAKSASSSATSIAKSASATSIAKGAKCNIPSSGLPKPKVNQVPAKIPSSGLPKPKVNKVPDKPIIPKAPKIPAGNSNDKYMPEKNSAKFIPKFIPKFKTSASQQKGNVSDKPSTSKHESKVLMKPDNEELKFDCELSHIEPVKEERKSFAPLGFQFQPPIELSSSLFSEDGPSAIFMKYKKQFIRTSTPKQDPSNQKSNCLKEDIECVEKEDTQQEKTECSKDTYTKIESSNKHDLNEVKLADCKQSLKFETLEEVPKLNQEERLLSPKIIHPEHLLAKSSSEAINSSVLPDSVEVDKAEINSATEAVSINHPSLLPDTEKIDEVEFNSTAVSPPAIPTVNLLDSANIEKPEINSSAISAPAVNLLDSVDFDKINTHSTYTGLIGDRITLSFLENDSVFPEREEMVNENLENNPLSLVLKGFQRQENGALKNPIKSRNFRRSEKPGLMSINESAENTPKSALKKKIQDGDFTPRRSLRLQAKFSGQFSSLENLPFSPKHEDKDKIVPKADFTPRRSSRLSRLSSSHESLFDVRRPTFCGSPEEDQPVPKICSKVTYDFDRLSLETDEEAGPQTTRSGKVSLLYSPRTSIMRRSIKGDLMSFSPNF